MREAAQKAGYGNASSIQRYIDGTYGQETIAAEIASKLADAFEGCGEPPIRRSEIFAWTQFGGNPQIDAPIKPIEPMPRDVPVYGTALGGDQIHDDEKIELTTLNTGEVVTYFKRPSSIGARKDVYGLFIQGSSMFPRFDSGEIAYVEMRRPPRIGDDVVLYLRTPDGDDGETISSVLIKRLVRRSSSHVTLEQFNPAITFELPAERVARIDRVIPWPELLT